LENVTHWTESSSTVPSSDFSTFTVRQSEPPSWIV
jgi:hypothetical protein